MNSSILKIKSTITAKENSNDNTIFSPVDNDKVKQCLQKLNPRKATGQDKMAAEPLSTPLSIAINNSFKCNIFPCNAKVACAKLVVKVRRKHCISNFRPVFQTPSQRFTKNLLKSF